MTSADEQERSRVQHLAQEVQEATGDAVELAFGDQGYTGEPAATDGATQGIELSVVKLPQAKRGFVLRPRRWGGGAFLRRAESFAPSGPR